MWKKYALCTLACWVPETSASEERPGVGFSFTILLHVVDVAHTKTTTLETLCNNTDFMLCSDHSYWLEWCAEGHRLFLQSRVALQQCKSVVFLYLLAGLPGCRLSLFVFSIQETWVVFNSCSFSPSSQSANLLFGQVFISTSFFFYSLCHHPKLGVFSFPPSAIAWFLHPV